MLGSKLRSLAGGVLASWSFRKAGSAKAAGVTAAGRGSDGAWSAGVATPARDLLSRAGPTRSPSRPISCCCLRGNRAVFRGLRHRRGSGRGHPST